MPDLPEEAMEGIPGLKQGRDACDVAYHGHGKSLGDAFALGLAIAAPFMRKQVLDEVEEASDGSTAPLRATEDFIRKQVCQEHDEKLRGRLEAKIERFWKAAQQRSGPTLNPSEAGKLAGLEAAGKAIFKDADDD